MPKVLTYNLCTIYVYVISSKERSDLPFLSQSVYFIHTVTFRAQAVGPECLMHGIQRFVVPWFDVISRESAHSIHTQRDGRDSENYESLHPAS